MAFVAPAAGMLALRAVAPPVLAVGRWGVNVLKRHSWLGWCVPVRHHCAAQPAQPTAQSLLPEATRHCTCGLRDRAAYAAAALARYSRLCAQIPSRLRARSCPGTAAPPADAPRARWVCGFAVAQYGNVRAKQRRFRTELTQVLADISGPDLQRLLGALPAWVAYPEYERVTWLNDVIKQARRPRRTWHAAQVGHGICAPADTYAMTHAPRPGRTSTRPWRACCVTTCRGCLRARP